MNKKLITTLVMSSMVVSAFAMSAGAAPIDKQSLKDEQGKVHAVQGKLGKVSGATAEERALKALDLVGQDFGFAKANGHFKVKASHKDENGVAHTRMDQVLNGIKVLDRQLIVHEQNGNVAGVSGDFAAVTANTTAAALSAQEASAQAVASTGYTGKLSRPALAELVYKVEGDQALLAYKVEVAFRDAAEPGRYIVLVDATNGSILSSVNTIEHVAGTGTGVLGDTKTIQTTLSGSSYIMKDTSRFTAGIITYDMRNGTTSGYNYTDADNRWTLTSHRAGVDAHFYAGAVYDYYKSLGRNSYNGAGAAIYSYTHYSTNYNNAYWDGYEMVYGDGDGVTFRSLSGSKDVVAHELTHAVTETTSGLVYENQSGALNESWSDAIASVVDGDDWNIGEDVYTPAKAGDALRSMSNPALYGQPAHMSQYQYLPNTEAGDWGGVHTNSGIPNKAFYNFATAIGSRTIAGKIWYTASRDYMTSTTNFAGARAATLSATAALYGSTSSYYTALQTAWSNVGVN